MEQPPHRCVLCFVTMFYVASCVPASRAERIAPSPPPIGCESREVTMEITYEIAPDCMPRNARAFLSGGWYSVDDTSGLVTDVLVSSLVDGSMTKRTVRLAGTPEKSLVCYVDAGHRVISASVREATENPQQQESDTEITVVDGELPDFGTFTYSELGTFDCAYNRLKSDHPSRPPIWSEILFRFGRSDM